MLRRRSVCEPLRKQAFINVKGKAESLLNCFWVPKTHLLPHAVTQSPNETVQQFCIVCIGDGQGRCLKRGDVGIHGTRLRQRFQPVTRFLALVDNSKLIQQGRFQISISSWDIGGISLGPNSIPLQCSASQKRQCHTATVCNIRILVSQFTRCKVEFQGANPAPYLIGFSIKRIWLWH